MSDNNWTSGAIITGLPENEHIETRPRNVRAELRMRVETLESEIRRHRAQEGKHYQGMREAREAIADNETLRDSYLDLIKTIDAA